MNTLSWVEIDDFILIANIIIKIAVRNAAAQANEIKIKTAWKRNA